MFHWRKRLSHEKRDQSHVTEKTNLPLGTVHDELQKLMVRRPY